jgi:hypothetical protein
MKQFSLYSVPAETEAIIPASSLLSVVLRRKLSGGWQIDTNVLPAAALFDKKTIRKSTWNDELYVVDESGKDVAIVEECDHNYTGCNYRWYNNANKERATEIRLLVYGDTRFDAICENVAVEVQPQADGSVILHNITTINGEDWKDFKVNREIRMKGFEFAVTKVGDGTFGGLRYLRENNGYNQFGSQYGNDDVRIALAPYSGQADYVLSLADQTDADEEQFVMCFIRAVKNPTEYLRIPIKELFAN